MVCAIVGGSIGAEGMFGTTCVQYSLLVVFYGRGARWKYGETGVVIVK